MRQGAVFVGELRRAVDVAASRVQAAWDYTRGRHSDHAVYVARLRVVHEALWFTHLAKSPGAVQPIVDRPRLALDRANDAAVHHVVAFELYELKASFRLVCD